MVVSDELFGMVAIVVVAVVVVVVVGVRGRGKGRVARVGEWESDMSFSTASLS